MAWSWRDLLGRLTGERAPGAQPPQTPPVETPPTEPPPPTPEGVSGEQGAGAGESGQTPQATQASAGGGDETGRPVEVNEEAMSEAKTPHDQPEASPRQALGAYHALDDVQSISGRRQARRAGSDSVSRIYARALLEMAEEKGQLAEIASEVGQLLDLLEGPEAGASELARLITTPAIGVEERRGLIDRVFKGRVSETTWKFLQVVNEKNRLGSLPEILAAFGGLLDERRGIVEVDVYVASRLDAGEAEQVARRIGAALKREVVLHQYVNPDLIGGLVIRVGDQLIDGSVATQLKLMRQKLIEAGRNKARTQNP